MTEIDASVTKTREEFEREVAKTSGATQYIILTLDKPSSAWKEGEKVTARSAEQAVRQAAEKSGQYTGGVTVVAIPARSWNPVMVTAKVVTTLEIKEARDG